MLYDFIFSLRDVHMLICVCLSPYVYIIITFICMHSFVCV